MRQAALLSIALCAVAAPAGAQSRAAPITKPIEYYNPDWSPDGRTIVFESTLSGTYSVYSINADGSDLKRLTADSVNNEQPRWSPDGKRIVFSSDRAGHLDLYVMNADGSNQTRLTTTSGGGYYQSSFSPDGKWIVFQGRPDNREVRDRVYVVASDGTGLHQITDSSYGAEGPRWSPDGKSIRFLQVPYPKRLWAEMQPADRDVAKAGERLVTVRADGSGLAPLPNTRKGDSVPALIRGDAHGLVRSPNGRRFAYTKSVDGWAGLYVYDIAARGERLLTGGPGAGPVGYLRTAAPTAGTDTMDTYESPRAGGQIQRGNGAWVVRSVRQVGGRRWETSDRWYDSTGRETARQSARTARGSLATETETVRATGDSASLLVTPDRVTAWVVPQGQPPRLFDGPAAGERYAGTLVAMAIAKSRPSIGTLFVAPSAVLYGPNPIETRVDSIRVVRRDTLFRGSAPLPVLVLERSSGTQLWMDETTGAELLSRGNAGPGNWWWHIRRGVRPPGIR
jgi:Tol biopolymer transport system component